MNQMVMVVSSPTQNHEKGSSPISFPRLRLHRPKRSPGHAGTYANEAAQYLYTVACVD
jgi:hypothetical protein